MFRILLFIVAARNRTRYLYIVSIVIVLNIVHCVAVTVVLHVRSHICLIVPQVVWCMVGIAARVVIPIIRRTPVSVCWATKTVEQRRTLIEHGFNDIVCSVNVRRADNLNIRRSVPHLNNKSGYVLIDIGGQHSLYKHDMRMSVQSL